MKEITEREEEELQEAHYRSFKNMDALRKEQLCGCFACLKIFSSSEIKEYVVEKGGGGTAVCPFCDIDSVQGESAGFPITEEFLKKMQRYYFSSNFSKSQTAKEEK